MADAVAEELARHLQLVDNEPAFGQSSHGRGLQAIQTTPLFSSNVSSAIREGEYGPEEVGEPIKPFPQYGLLGLRLGTYSQNDFTPASSAREDNLIYANTNAPWSTFICGSQGGGKSHTLSCLLENCLLSSSSAGELPNPLAGLVLHYDKFTSSTTTQLCEAAYLCSAGIPVRVLVSPSNYYNMERLYSNLPGLAPGSPKPTVMPLYLEEQQLNISNIKTLMAVSGRSESKPLYLGVLFQILRDLKREAQERSGIDYSEFKRRINEANFAPGQTGPLQLRLQLLESFLNQINGSKKTTYVTTPSSIWDFKPGSLTIVDLSDPFVEQDDACALFSICLALFMESRGKAGRILVLDEAHKFLTQSAEALSFTEDLLSIIRQQRHLATRVVIATQEPTLSPALIDLCNVTIVHQFLSPAWYETLKHHLAGARPYGGNASGSAPDSFRTIVGLRTGEALLFSPTALFSVGEQDETDTSAKPPLEKLIDSYIKIRIRKRVTTDGGKSIMASDAKAQSLE